MKAVDHISFEIYKGETVGVVGESGCGKSTLGRCLVNLYEATGGDVYFKGVNLKKYRKQPLKKKLCQNAQMIFQNLYAPLNPRMTVKEIVGEGIKLYHRHITDAAKEICKRETPERKEVIKGHYVSCHLY
ncbi:protein of unknown function [Ruminococcaceae bacterium BL-6]|nr:protein of unknown function [Ruminococcaceae bacterium BL-6]